MPSYTIYSDANDFDLFSEDATYSVARESVLGLFNSTTGSNSVVGQDYLDAGSGFVYDVFQTFYSFDTSSVTGTFSSGSFNANVVFAADYSRTFELRAHAWASQNSSAWVAGSALSGKTLLASMSPGTTTGAKSATLSSLTISSAWKMVFAGQNQRTNTAPVGNERLYLYTANQSGTTNDPYLSITTTTSTPGNASGTLGTVTVSSASGSASGGASASGTAATITVIAPTGSATGTAQAAGTGAVVNLVSPAGSAAGDANVSGGGQRVTVSPPTGAASVDVEAAGPAGTVTVSAPEGVASGDAEATGAAATVALSSPDGSAVGEANASGLGATVTVSAPTGAVTGDAAASGGIGTVTVVSPAGGAGAAENGDATGQGATVSVIAPAGSATGSGQASGNAATISVVAPAGSARGNASASGLGKVIQLFPPQGSATGYEGMPTPPSRTAQVIGRGRTATATLGARTAYVRRRA